MSSESKFKEFGLIIKLLIGIAAGVVIGLFANHAVMEVVVTAKYVMGQFIFYTVPLVILAFIAPAITRLGQNASKMLGVGVSLAYLSAAGAATMAAVAGYRPYSLIFPLPHRLKVFASFPKLFFSCPFRRSCLL